MSVHNEYVIETCSLSKRFGNKVALHDLSLKILQGGAHAVIGSNGAGKSTLFRILLGVLSPSEGSSQVLGENSEALSPATRGKIALVNEEHTLPGWMTVSALSAMQRALYPEWEEGTFREVLGHFNVPDEQKISQLSRGERAGINLATALAQSPKLLILDEPTLGLDVVAKQACLESLLFVGEREDCTIVYCSHQMDEIERIADNLMILERGELVSASPPEEFCDRISYWVADSLVGSPSARTIPGLLQARDVEGQHHLVVLDQGEGTGERLEGLGAKGVLQVPIGLDRAVNAFLSRNHAAPQPQESATCGI